MKLKLSVAALTAAGMLVGAAVHAQDSDTDRSHPKAFVKDSAITTKIKSKLAAEHVSSLAHVRVDTDKDGVVWLSGTAPNKDAVRRAEDIARNTDGVRSVHNELVVRPAE